MILVFFFVFNYFFFPGVTCLSLIKILSVCLPFTPPSNNPLLKILGGMVELSCMRDGGIVGGSSNNGKEEETPRKEHRPSCKRTSTRSMHRYMLKGRA